MKSRLGRFFFPALSVAALGSSALAVTPTMPAIDLPIDASSIVTAVATAGATMLIAVIGVTIGFRLIRKLAKRATSAV